MKKFLSIVAVLALVLSLSAVAFAAQSPVGPESATCDQGEVIIAPSSETYENAEVVEVKVIDKDGKELTEGPFEVAFVYDKAGDVVAVKVKGENGWDDAEIVSQEGNKLVVKLPHLSPVAFVLKAAAPVPGDDTKKDASTGTKPAATAAKASPKTGYNTAVWALSAAAMAIAAGYCFSRKKVTE